MKLNNLFIYYFRITLFIYLLILVNSKEQCFDITSGEKSISSNSNNEKNNCNNVKNTDALLSRKRRALLFPDGSRLLITASLVKAILVGIPLGWNVALELDVFYEMDKKKIIIDQGIKFIRLQHHLQRRDVWDHMEGVFKLYGMDGQPCILRAICEAQQYLAPKSASLVHDLLKLIFSAPAEDGPHDEYTGAHTSKDCTTFHEECPFSLLQLILSYQRV